MALTPITIIIDEEITEDVATSTSVETQPSKTFELDLLNGQIGGYIDGEQAIQQFIRKAVFTARNRYLIYSDAYGSELSDLVSKNLPFSVLEIEIPRLIEDALVYDDRIASVGNFVLTQESDKLFVSFVVALVNGETVESEVTI